MVSVEINANNKLELTPQILNRFTELVWRVMETSPKASRTRIQLSYSQKLSYDLQRQLKGLHGNLEQTL